MYAQGAYLVHPGQGVCVVESITEGENPSYKLMPLGQRNPVLISFPVAEEERLRPVCDANEAHDIIRNYSDMLLSDETASTSALEEELFREEIRTGSCRDIVRIVKTFRSRIQDARALNKKPPVAYERILKHASQRSLSELAVALDATTDDVIALFKEAIGEDITKA